MIIVKSSGIDWGCYFGWADTGPGSITKSSNMNAFFIVTSGFQGEIVQLS
jgi:hypothetical protein